MKIAWTAALALVLLCTQGLQGQLPAPVRQGLERLQQAGWDGQSPALVIDPATQQLYHWSGRQHAPEVYAISTAKAGLGTQRGSGRTPTGLHAVAQKYGSGAPPGMIFRGRQATGQQAEITTDATDQPEDQVTTRILWLRGLEEGHNQGGAVDSHARYIYIHGTPEEGLIGQPASHGCIRMRNAAVIELFRQVPEGTLVLILDRPPE